MKHFVTLMILTAALGLSQTDTTHTTFTSAIAPLTKFETLELLPNAATQLCSGSTLSVTRTSGTILSLGNSSSATLPQTVRFGYKSRQLTAATTLTMSAGTATGTITVFAFNDAGTLALGVINPTANTMACASSIGCTVATPGSVTGQNIINTGMPIWTWTITSGAFDVSGGTQQQTGQDCWVDNITISNNTASAVTLVLTDNQSTPIVLLPTVSLAANSTTEIVWPGGVYFESGMKLTSGTASALTVKVRGGRSTTK